jgi:secreted trypsin-like serine protease
VGRSDIAGFYASGVLALNRTLVITAAHCGPAGFSSLPNRAALRVTNLSRLANAELLDGDFKSHPQYVLGGAYDIAVLILRKNAKTPPVSLATTAELQAATEVTIVGFGNDNLGGTSGFGIQHFVTVPIQYLSGGATNRSLAGNIEFDEDLEFVAGTRTAGACFGDSGGPAYIMADGARKLAGIVSRPPSTQHPACNGLTIFTRVDRHQEWIMSHF